LLHQLPTSGLYTQLTPGKREELAAAIGDAVDSVGGSFTMSYATVAVTAVRAGDPRPRG
jgi:hypothetical protein